MPLTSVFYAVPYVLVFCMLALCAVPVTGNILLDKETKRVQTLFCVFTITIFLGFRGFIHTDWYSYHAAFDEAPVLGKASYDFDYFFNRNYYASNWEKGFSLFMILCKSIVSEWWFFQLTAFLINFAVDIWFIKSFVPKHIVLGLCFYFLFGGLSYDINLMRNSKAIMFFILSLRYAADKKIIQYMLLNIAGFFFHSSALFFLPLYFILGKEPKKQVLWILFIAGNAVYLLQLHWCMPIVAQVAEMIGGRTARIAVQYLESERWSSGYGISIGYLERTATFLLLMKYRKQLIVNKYNIPVVNCMTLFLFSHLFLSEMSILTDRIPRLFIFAYWVIYPQIYEYLKKDMKLFFLLIFILYSIMKLISGEQSLVCSYDNILFPKYTIEQRENMLNRFKRFSDAQLN